MLQAECAATEILAETVNFPSSSRLRCYKKFLFPATAHLAATIYRLFCQSIQVSHCFENFYLPRTAVLLLINVALSTHIAGLLKQDIIFRNKCLYVPKTSWRPYLRLR